MINVEQFLRVLVLPLLAAAYLGVAQIADQFASTPVPAAQSQQIAAVNR